MELHGVKRNLIGTAVGGSLLRGRQLLELWRAVRSNPERGGIVCQDVCAWQLLPALCRAGSAFVDVGAHIGSVVAHIRAHHPTLQVIAIEADPEKAMGIAVRFPNVEVHRCAVGDQNGEVSFYVDVDQPGYSSLVPQRKHDQQLREIKVRMWRLDDFLAPSIPVELMKIDVEGAELRVLRGGAKLVDRCRPVVLFESTPAGAGEAEPRIEELFHWFSARSYEIFVPNRVPHEGPPLHRESFLESHVYPFRTLNYFAIPVERRAEIRRRARSAFGIIEASTNPL